MLEPYVSQDNNGYACVLGSPATQLSKKIIQNCGEWSNSERKLVVTSKTVDNFLKDISSPAVLSEVGFSQLGSRTVGKHTKKLGSDSDPLVDADISFKQDSDIAPEISVLQDIENKLQSYKKLNGSTSEEPDENLEVISALTKELQSLYTTALNKNFALSERTKFLKENFVSLIETQLPHFKSINIMERGICGGLATSFISASLVGRESDLAERLQILCTDKRTGWIFFGKHYHTLVEPIEEAKKQYHKWRETQNLNTNKESYFFDKFARENPIAFQLLEIRPFLEQLAISQKAEETFFPTRMNTTSNILRCISPYELEKLKENGDFKETENILFQCSVDDIQKIFSSLPDGVYSIDIPQHVFCISVKGSDITLFDQGLAQYFLRKPKNNLDEIIKHILKMPSFPKVKHQDSINSSWFILKLFAREPENIKDSEKVIRSLATKYNTIKKFSIYDLRKILVASLHTCIDAIEPTLRELDLKKAKDSSIKGHNTFANYNFVFKILENYLITFDLYDVSVIKKLVSYLQTTSNDDSFRLQFAKALEISEKKQSLMLLTLLNKNIPDVFTSEYIENLTLAISVILTYNSNLNIIDKNGMRALDFAIHKQLIPVLELFIKEHVNMHYLNKEKKTPLKAAIETGNNTIIKMITDAREEKEQNLLGEKKYYDLFKLAFDENDVKKAASVYYSMGDNKELKLFNLFLDHNFDDYPQMVDDLLKYLISQGLNINTPLNNGERPLDLAIRHKSLFLLKALQNHKVETHYEDIHYKTCLDKARDSNNKEIFEYVKSLHAYNEKRLSEADEGYIQLVVESVQMGDFSLFDLFLISDEKPLFLIQKTVKQYIKVLDVTDSISLENIQQVLEYLETPISEADLKSLREQNLLHVLATNKVSNNSENNILFDILSLLQKIGISVDQQDNNGVRALDIAIINENTAYVEALLKHNVEADYINHRGLTTMETALETGNSKILDLLKTYLNKNS